MADEWETGYGARPRQFRRAAHPNSRPLLIGLLTGQAFVAAIWVIVLFFGPWLVGPQDLGARPDRSGTSLAVVFVVGVTALLATAVLTVLKTRRGRPAWWIPLAGIAATSVTAAASLEYLGG